MKTKRIIIQVLRVLLFVFVIIFFVRGFMDWNNDAYECTLEYFDYSCMCNKSYTGSLEDLKIFLNVTEYFLVDNIDVYEHQRLRCREYHVLEHKY